MRVIGVDVGGTSIKARCFELAAPGDVPDATPGVRALGDERRSPTPKGADAVLTAIAEVVERLRADGFGDAVAIGVVVPGIVDEAQGVAVHAANVGWERTPVRDRLSALSGLPVALGHDVRAGGLAEWRLGAGRGSANVLVVMLGTGIGSAVISDGRLLTGDGYAGQLGHISVRADGPPCGCGQRGCLGVLASASAVARRYNERIRETGRAGTPAAGEPPAVTGAREVAELARAGDPTATAVWDETVTTLADALTVAVTLFGSEVVVLGGGLSLAGDRLIRPVDEGLRARLTFQRLPRVVPAELGDGSGILGAALLGARAAAEDPADRLGG